MSNSSRLPRDLMSLGQYERILLTGGTGFIGSAVFRSLLSKGSQPLVINRSETNLCEQFETTNLDLSDRSAITGLLRTYQPDLIIHLAGASISGDPSRKYNAELYFGVTTNLLEESVRCGTKRIILLGSAAEYGDHTIPFNEEMELRPISDYARSKAQITRFAMELAQSAGLNVTILRPFTAYGPGQPSNMFMSQLVRHAILNHDFNMSDGLQLRDFVYRDDVADAVVLAAGSGQASGRIINIGSGVGIPLRDAAAMVWNKCSADPEKLHIGAIGKSEDDALDTMADIDLASELLNWRPTVTFATGVDRMIHAMTSPVSETANARHKV